AGRIGRGAPAAIEIPPDRLFRHDVELQAITASPDAKDVVDGVGGLVVCSRDQAITGAVFKLAGMAEQVRLAFPTTWSPYDLDCDDHDVQFQNDCNDLSTLFNPDELTETCDSPDFNCDHLATDSTTSCVVVDPNDPSNTACIGASSCSSAGACVPITSDGACRCIVDTCEVATCSIAYMSTGAGAVNPCAPAGTGRHLCSDAEKPCKFTILSLATVLLIRAIPATNLPLTAGQVFGEVDVERVSASGTTHLLLTIGMDADASPQCVPNSFDPSTSTMVCQ
ncbi:MAG: hypothetical protein NT062_38390, partial [Proteobacteria bacterium]|nr:hypothetical protein [Pseudomonadota bacterium]